MRAWYILMPPFADVIIAQGWRMFAGVRWHADADTAAAAHSNITPLILDIMHEDSVIAAAQQVAAVHETERHERARSRAYTQLQ